MYLRGANPSDEAVSPTDMGVFGVGCLGDLGRVIVDRYV